MSVQCGVCVIGGGPAGLAAAIAAEKEGAKVVLIEREARLGGILKQCVHDGFGLVRFGEKLAGPEYAERYLDLLKKTTVHVMLHTFVDNIRPHAMGWHLTVVTSEGMRHIIASAIVLATGCRERTARQVAIHGTRPAGLITAGAAQYYTNILGQLPGRRCVILGSGDIGLIMARRLTLEGAQVLGVYEAKPVPSGLPRNIAQCLNDFGIPLHLSKTVTQVFGSERLEAVEIAEVGSNMQPVNSVRERVACDALILSVGLIPENELAETLGVELHPVTKGPLCDQNGMTNVPGVFSCGNAAHVNDLVDYVSESGESAGRAAARYAAKERAYLDIVPDSSFLYAFPQRVDVTELGEKTVLFFRSRDECDRTRVIVKQNGRELFKKTYRKLRPPEMERVAVPITAVGPVTLEMEVLS
ncbi:MAG: NAD(P)/FAD-dependent oxidoreductase [Oscillospiraceae bacterium]|jgi:NADPH-dependent 2,4-dienoyl-CoA reductase/sulfur reductase-like enzyme|nr:NAD(P)/FAD-dependent oxidoreductase [Oscillospiraceae bacterium]